MNLTYINSTLLIPSLLDHKAGSKGGCAEGSDSTSPELGFTRKENPKAFLRRS